ncbi:hypothetical protein B0H63DRAFT_469914 [Podospora didyma]|uniref:Uncharacterized protein n=1 Tax=Podospora didyma TaxID=330526 RepID=A0AAE0NTE5_9PEZI|nr:hypothetical protein B0H63DRAFT_469914 [Podospora didyma]
MTNELTRPWGFLPAMQHLIRNWDLASPLSPAAERASLVSGCIAQDIPPSYAPVLDGTPPRVPTATILAPWRQLEMRKIAYFLWTGYWSDLIILRTYYNGGDGREGGEGEEKGDQNLAGWLEVGEERDVLFDPDALWWRVLDNAEVFAGLGEGDGAWEKVLEVLPELVGRQGDSGGAVRRGVSQAELDEIRQERDPDDWEEAIRFRAFSLSRPSPLLAADKRAFEEDKLKLHSSAAMGMWLRSLNLRPRLWGR